MYNICLLELYINFIKPRVQASLTDPTLFISSRKRIRIFICVFGLRRIMYRKAEIPVNAHMDLYKAEKKIT